MHSLDLDGRGGMRACPGSRPKDVCGSLSEASQLPDHQGKGGVVSRNYILGITLCVLLLGSIAIFGRAVQSTQLDSSGIGRLLVQEVEAYPSDKLDDLTFLLMANLAKDEFGNFTATDPVNKIQSVEIIDIQNGSTKIGARLLPSAIVTINIKTINRGSGSYGNLCIRHAAVMDAEFRMLRDPIYALCEGSNAEFASWSKTHGIAQMKDAR